jgi:hypothetical protein
MHSSIDYALKSFIRLVPGLQSIGHLCPELIGELHDADLLGVGHPVVRSAAAFRAESLKVQIKVKCFVFLVQ